MTELLADLDFVAELDDGDEFCHFVDEQHRALCFADVSGRPIHATGEKIVDGGWNRAAYEGRCHGCGRPRCPKCLAISNALRGNAA